MLFYLHFNRGLAYDKLRQWGKAADDYSEALKQRPGEYRGVCGGVCMYMCVGLGLVVLCVSRCVCVCV